MTCINTASLLLLKQMHYCKNNYENFNIAHKSLESPWDHSQNMTMLVSPIGIPIRYFESRITACLIRQPSDLTATFDARLMLDSVDSVTDTKNFGRSSCTLEEIKLEYD